MAKPAARHATPDGENDPTLATPRAKPAQLLPSRSSMTNITNSVASKRILPPHMQSAAMPKRPSESLKSAMSSSSNATPQPRRKRTDAEPATVTPRPKTFFDKSSGMRQMQSVSDISRLTAASSSSDDTSRADEIEPVKAYLRIRPPSNDAPKESARPYIEVVSDTEVLMHPPSQSAYSSGIPGFRSRTASIAPPTKYIFSKVFGSQTNSSGAQQDMSQSAFFQQTTLPLVEALLQGESGLMFTYGVTNSGKSHTVMGNSEAGGAGILPRSLDVIFNSIKGVESTASIQPSGVSGVQRFDKQSAQAEATSSLGVNPFLIPSVSRRLFGEAPSRAAKPSKPMEHDATKVPVDRNLRYSVFVSYVEIYNEKLFDLLDVSPGSTLGRSESVRGSNWSLANLANAAPSSIPASASSITLNRKPLSLKNDHENGGKYVAGLREIKVTSAQEARDLLHRGQENRAVFGTMANRASSRSHGIFTIKVIRHHGGLTTLSDDDLDSFTTARLSIVDLAGSERVANTGLASGDRLKEAGNINKSLMCLGQCLETLRKNQVRLTGSTEGGQAATVKRRMSIVPFRHSKLTELFQSFFVGEGKAVMIVNANPYDTGFDENSHVMKFSAIAKEVAVPRHTGAVTKMLPPLPPVQERASGSRSLPKSKSSIDIIPSDSETSADVTIIEDDEELDDENHDSFVDMLVEKHEELRQKLHAAELRCATIEAEVRQEMADEMEHRLLEMEEFYNRRMMTDAEQNAQFTNRKIDLLVSTQARNEPDLSTQGDSELHLSDMSVSDDDHYESGHDEAEVEGALASKRGGGLDRSMSEVSASDQDSVFDDAVEGDISAPIVIDDDSEQEQASDGEHDDDDESAILKPGRIPQRRAASQGKNYAISESSISEAGEDDSDLESESDAASASDEDDDNMSSAVSAAGDDENDSSDDSDADEDDDPDSSRLAAERGETQAFIEIASSLPDGSLDSIASAPVAKDSDSSFDDGSAFSDSDEDEDSRSAPRPPQRKSGRTSNVNNSARGSNGSTATTRARRSSNKPRNSVIDLAGQLTDLSDASMVVEETVTPKKKRKLRKKAAVQEDDWVEQIGDSSLVEAVYSTNNNSARASGASRASRSFSSRKSGRY
ncbi:Kinesin, motor domain protein [Kalmanozyma brasiliensis GHG001]|uniref:Kinesin, motor domain protein n=1 Tax=Kalmanozyma brasiliensis (strain GHG001) TaxID=1365824 RepID=UPI002868195F|nr:Kinesin, motor domain protein [Kalmanozyma brasiliensis GHG001]KAF6766987.1 Kinesin, motor domain protein [Kalmanozyma brasiliensis GHG001]